MNAVEALLRSVAPHGFSNLWALFMRNYNLRFNAGGRETADAYAWLVVERLNATFHRDDEDYDQVLPVLEHALAVLGVDDENDKTPRLHFQKSVHPTLASLRRLLS